MKREERRREERKKRGQIFTSITRYSVNGEKRGRKHYRDGESSARAGTEGKQNNIGEQRKNWFSYKGEDRRRAGGGNLSEGLGAFFSSRDGW